MATITLSNILPSTPPSNGWKVTYRILGTSGSFLNAPGSPFSSQPIVFSTADPSNTDYEGYVVTDCGSGNLGTQYYWETANLVFSITKSSGDTIDMTPFINGTFNKVDWGDGTINTSLTHTYSTSGNFTIKFYNSTTTKFESKVSGGPGSFLGNITSLNVLPPAVTQLIIYTDSSFGTLDSLIPNVNLINLRINNESYSLSTFPPFNTFVNLQTLWYIGFNQSTIDISNNTALTAIDLSKGVLSTLVGLNSTPLVNTLLLSQNNLSVAEINSILITLDNNGVNNGTVDLRDQAPLAAPSGLGITAKNNLISKGWTVQTD